VTRSLQWDGCVNVRDLGGVPTADGGHTRFDAFVRADNVRKLSETGWADLYEHGVRRIVDLRWPEELAEDVPHEVHIDVVHISLLGELDPEFIDDIDDYIDAEDPAGYWSSAYTSILEEHHENFGRTLAAIADAPDGVVLFHCAGGKDRTGLVAALLLRLAGAEIDDVAADYALSEANLATGPQTWIESSRNDAERRRRTFMQQTPAEAMTRALEALDEQYGDVRAYLRAGGVTDEQLDRLEGRLVAA